MLHHLFLSKHVYMNMKFTWTIGNLLFTHRSHQLVLFICIIVHAMPGGLCGWMKTFPVSPIMVSHKISPTQLNLFSFFSSPIISEAIQFLPHRTHFIVKTNNQHSTISTMVYKKKKNCNNLWNPGYPLSVCVRIAFYLWTTISEEPLTGLENGVNWLFICSNRSVCTW